MLFVDGTSCEKVLELVLESLEVVDVDGVEDDADDEDAKEGECQGDAVDEPGQHGDSSYGPVCLATATVVSCLSAK